MKRHEKYISISPYELITLKDLRIVLENAEQLLGSDSLIEVEMKDHIVHLHILTNSKPPPPAPPKPMEYIMYSEGSPVGIDSTGKKIQLLNTTKPFKNIIKRITNYLGLCFHDFTRWEKSRGGTQYKTCKKCGKVFTA